MPEIAMKPDSRWAGRESALSAYLKELTSHAQRSFACRSTCSGAREAATALAIAAPSLRCDSNSALPLSDPLKGLQYLVARRPLARPGAARLGRWPGFFVIQTPNRVVQDWEPNRRPPLEACLHLPESPHPGTPLLLRAFAAS